MAAGDSPLTRVQGALGQLPELTPGFHPGEPASALTALGEARHDYLWMQAFDLLFAALVAMTALFSLARFSRKPAAPVIATRYLTLAPCIFVAAELIENSMLSLFAAGAVGASPAAAFIQQAATTLKLLFLAPVLILSLSAFAPPPNGGMQGEISA